jgi:hypothetical protein
VNFLARDVNEAHCWDLFFAQISETDDTWGMEWAKPFFLPLLWSAKLDTPMSMSRIQGTDLSAVAMSAGT